MRYKIHPICKLCNLQNGMIERKSIMSGFEPHSDIEVHYCDIAYHFKNIVGQVITQFIINMKRFRMKLVVVKTKMITSIMMKKVMKYELMFQKMQLQQWLMLVIIVILYKIWRKVNRD